jgi:hypothetical protein
MNMIGDLWQDLRYSLRMLRKHPGLTIVAALSLALGIGGNASMFSLINSAFIRPLHYAEPDRLVQITEPYPKAGVVAMQERSRTMEVAAYLADQGGNLTGEGEAPPVGQRRLRQSFLSARRAGQGGTRVCAW